MAAPYTQQFAKTDTLAATMTAAETTSATLTTGNFTNFTGDFLVVDYDVPAKREVILCTVTGTAISSITRAQEGTSAVEHAAGAKVGYMHVPSHYSVLKDTTGWSPVWTAWTPTITVSGGTAPTYTENFQNRYYKIGKLVIAQMLWTNASGGTAGAGANAITFTLPVNAANIGTTRLLQIGHGQAWESGGTIDDVSAILTAAGTAQIELTLATVLAGNDQSSENRMVVMTLIYEVA